MKILLSNDDGYFAPGIQILFKLLLNQVDFEQLETVATDKGDRLCFKTIQRGQATTALLQNIVESIQKGIGDTLGFLVLILGFGAMLGKLVADSGAAQRITSRLISGFGVKNIQWAVVVAGFIVGVPMFYSVGFVILICSASCSTLPPCT